MTEITEKGYLPTPKDVKDKTREELKKYKLTDREIDVLELIAEGIRNHRIAKELRLSENTTRNHLSSIYRRLNIPNMTAAVAFYCRLSRQFYN